MSVFLQPLQTVTVGSGGASSITFSSIPQGYTDLVIKISVRDSGSGPYQLSGRFNGDSGINYSNTLLQANGNSASSGNSANGNAVLFGLSGGSSETSNVFAINEIYIPNYTGSNYKSFVSDAVTENNGSVSYQYLTAGLWRSTSAITSITALATNSFVQYSTFALYGILRQGI
jgi:hypothetical protein